jgi:AP-1 complex subunit beta-1
MACIRVKKIVEYLILPLGKCIDDVDPYVRKTAAICISKFYDMDPQRCEEENFIERLRHMIGDSSPMVVSNAVAALSDISETIGRDVLRLKPKLVNKLLAALNECSEWGQIVLLDALASYIPEDEEEAMLIVERTIPRLQHVNSAVMLG